jgi:hypothetical protein
MTAMVDTVSGFIIVIPHIRTLTRLTAQRRKGTVVRLLDDAATLRAAQDDPTGFVEHDELMVIDEIRLAPELLRAAKVLVDLNPRPGRFLLAGSSRILALRTLPGALPGRMEVIELRPFAQGEMSGGPDLSSTRLSGMAPGRHSADDAGALPRAVVYGFLIKSVPAWSSSQTARAIGPRNSLTVAGSRRCP